MSVSVGCRAAADNCIGCGVEGHEMDGVLGLTGAIGSQFLTDVGRLNAQCTSDFCELGCRKGIGGSGIHGTGGIESYIDVECDIAGLDGGIAQVDIGNMTYDIGILESQLIGPLIVVRDVLVPFMYDVGGGCRTNHEPQTFGVLGNGEGGRIAHG